MHDSVPRMRAIFSASIFHEWRDGTYAWRGEEARLSMGARPGHGCRLAHCRASMGRLIAGLNVHMFPQTQGIREAIAYAADALPAGGFQPPAPPSAAPGVTTADECGAGPTAGPPTLTADEGGAGHAPHAADDGRTRDGSGRVLCSRR